MATQAEQVIALAGAGNALPFARFRVPFCRSLPLQQVWLTVDSAERVRLRQPCLTPDVEGLLTQARSWAAQVVDALVEPTPLAQLHQRREDLTHTLKLYSNDNETARPPFADGVAVGTPREHLAIVFACWPGHRPRAISACAHGWGRPETTQVPAGRHGLGQGVRESWRRPQLAHSATG